MEGKLLDTRIDYLDLQLHRGPVKTTVFFDSLDEDGVPVRERMSVIDKVGYELFQFLGEFPDQKRRAFSGEYSTKNRDIFFESYPLVASLQLKGRFFLRADYKEKLQEIINYLKSQGIPFTVSRIDLAYTFTYEGSFFKDLMKSDFKNLNVRPLIKKKEYLYLKAENSRFEMAAYNKTEQVKKEKGDDYKDSFLMALGLDDLPENLYRMDLRLRQKDVCKAVLETLYLEKINFEDVEKEIIKQASNRMIFPKKIRQVLDPLKKSSI